MRQPGEQADGGRAVAVFVSGRMQMARSWSGANPLPTSVITSIPTRPLSNSAPPTREVSAC